MKGPRKHIKRARNERVRNHYKEWETDLINWLENNIDKKKGVAITTQKQLCEELGISNSSLNELFKRTNRIEKHTITGRRGQTYYVKSKENINALIRLYIYLVSSWLFGDWDIKYIFEIRLY